MIKDLQKKSFAGIYLFTSRCVYRIFSVYFPVISLTQRQVGFTGCFPACQEKVFSISLLWAKFFWICILLIYQKKWVAYVHTRHFAPCDHRAVFIPLRMIDTTIGLKKKIYSVGTVSFTEDTMMKLQHSGQTCYYTQLGVTSMMSTSELTPHGCQM